MFQEGFDEGTTVKGLHGARSGGIWSSSLLVQDPCLHCLPAHTEKGDQDSITFSFLFYLTHIPLVKKPESAWELFVETRPAAVLSSGSPAACRLISYPWGHHLPLRFSTLCLPLLHRSLLSAWGAPSSWSHSPRGLRGRPWGPKCLPGKDDKDGECWAPDCGFDYLQARHSLPGTLRGSYPPICTIWHLLKVSRGSEQPLKLFTAVGFPGELPNALSLRNSGEPVTHPV